MLPRYFIAGTGLDGRVLHVRIVDLQLDELRTGVLRQGLFQKFRGRMEREAPVFDEALLLQFLHVLPEVPVLIDLPVIVLDGMEQVEVHIVRAEALEARIDLLFGLLFRVAGQPGVQFGRDGEGISRIAFDERGAHRLLRLPVLPVDISGVEVGAAGRHEAVHHLFGLLKVRVFPVFQHRKAHEPEAELLDLFPKICHRIPFPSAIYESLL